MYLVLCFLAVCGFVCLIGLLLVFAWFAALRFAVLATLCLLWFECGVWCNVSFAVLFVLYFVLLCVVFPDCGLLLCLVCDLFYLLV